MDQKVASLLFVACALVACFSSAEAGLGFGKCPQKEAMKNFALDMYVGRWYEIARFGAYFERNRKCIQAVYTKEGDGIKVVNIGLDIDSNKKSYIEGTAKPSDNSGDAKLDVTFPGAGPLGGNRTGPYWVLSTDYENYALVYSCSSWLFVHYDFGWILSRTPKISQMLRDKVDELVVKNGLKVELFEDTIQTCEGPLDP